jgi:hypothetical protein
MGVAFGDFDGDALPDVIKTNFAGDHPNLYRNTGKGIFDDAVIRAGLGVNPQYVGWGVGLVDLDNDGWPDIFQVNGHVYPELDAKPGGGGGGEQYRNPRLVYRSLGGGKFEDVSAMSGAAIAEKRSSRGAAFGDIDNDGDIDVLIMNMNEAPTLLRNDQNSGHRWVRLKLTGAKSPKSAIGATVRLTSGGRTQVQAVLSQSSFVSQNDLRLHFGLGAAARVDRVEIMWPGGAVQQAGPFDAVDRTIDVPERAQ